MTKEVGRVALPEISGKYFDCTTDNMVDGTDKGVVIFHRTENTPLHNGLTFSLRDGSQLVIVPDIWLKQSV